MIQGRPYDTWITHEGINRILEEQWISTPPWLSAAVRNMMLQTPEGYMSVDQLLTYFDTLIIASNAVNTPLSMEARQQLLKLMWLFFWTA